MLVNYLSHCIPSWQLQYVADHWPMIFRGYMIWVGTWVDTRFGWGPSRHWLSCMPLPSYGQSHRIIGLLCDITDTGTLAGLDDARRKVRLSAIHLTEW